MVKSLSDRVRGSFSTGIKNKNLGRFSPILDLLWLFIISLVAMTLPVGLQNSVGSWIWALPGAASMCLAAWFAMRWRAAGGVQPYVWCVVLIGLAMGIDFWWTSPEVVLSQCRTRGDRVLIAEIIEHVSIHWQWFPVSSIAMLGIVWFEAVAYHAPGRDRRPLVFLVGPHQLLRGVAKSCGMLGLMGGAMGGVFALAERGQPGISGTAMMSAMACGMAAYHFWDTLLAGRFKPVA